MRLAALLFPLALAAPNALAAGPRPLTDDDWASISPASYPFRFTYSAKCGNTSTVARITPCEGGCFRLAVDAIGNLVPGPRMAKWDGQQWVPGDEWENPGSVDAEFIIGPDRYLALAAGVGGAEDGSHQIVRRGESDLPLGEAFNGSVTSLVAFEGELYASGSFTQVGEVPVNHVARWDGSAWSAVGEGIDESGRLYAGDHLYAVSVHKDGGSVAMWDGSAWVRLGSVDWSIWDAAVVGSDLYIAGDFNSVGGKEIRFIARWNGESWSALGPGLDGSVTNVVAKGSDLYVCGRFLTAGDVLVNRVARWDGASWHSLGTGIESDIDDPMIQGYGFFHGPWVTSMVVGGDGNLYVSGVFHAAGGVIANSIARWDGAAWSRVGENGAGITGPVRVLKVAGDRLYAGGAFPGADGRRVNGVAMWDGTSWSALGSGLSGRRLKPFIAVNDVLVAGPDVYVGGRFTSASGTPAANIAKWDGTSWSALGAGVNGEVSQLLMVGSNLYVAGSFSTAGDVEAARIAKWDGTSWSALGSGFQPTIDEMIRSDHGIIATGWFPRETGAAAIGVAAWDGTTWTPFGEITALDLEGPNDREGVFALARWGSDLYAAGRFNAIGGVAASNIAKWDGTSWSPLGPGLSKPGTSHYVSALASHGGYLYASVVFSEGGYCEEAPPPSQLFRWDGVSWTAVGSRTNRSIYTLAVLGDELYVGGAFDIAGGKASGNLAKVFLNGVPAFQKTGSKATAFFRGLPAGGHQVERTTDFLSWVPLATRFATESGGIDFTDEHAPEPQAFYRTVKVASPVP